MTTRSYLNALLANGGSAIGNTGGAATMKELSPSDFAARMKKTEKVDRGGNIWSGTESAFDWIKARVLIMNNMDRAGDDCLEMAKVPLGYTPDTGDPVEESFLELEPTVTTFVTDKIAERIVLENNRHTARMVIINAVGNALTRNNQTIDEGIHHADKLQDINIKQSDALYSMFRREKDSWTNAKRIHSNKTGLCAKVFYDALGDSVLSSPVLNLLQERKFRKLMYTLDQKYGLTGKRNDQFAVEKYLMQASWDPEAMTLGDFFADMEEYFLKDQEIKGHELNDATKILYVATGIKKYTASETFELEISTCLIRQKRITSPSRPDC